MLVSLSSLLAIALVTNQAVVVWPIRSVHIHQSQRRIRESSPTVYLAFKALIKSQRAGIKDDVLLELSNNTRWNILYHVLPKMTESPEANVLYKIEDEKGTPAFAENIGDILIRKVLPPGQSVAFLVPGERLAKGYRTYVEFSYEWETRTPGALLAGEPNHRVYFSYYDLPARLRASKS